MGIPNTVNDEVKYAPANLYATEDCLFDIDEGSRLDIYGDVYLNGDKLSISSSVDPRKYGYTVYPNPGYNDGVKNSAALQSAIDEACGPGDPLTSTRSAVKRVVIPSGISFINNPINIRSVIGLHIVGEGNAELRVNANMTSVLDINGMAYGSIENLRITGSAGVQVDNAIYTYWDSAGSFRSNTANLYWNIFIGLDFITGIQVGVVGASVDVSDDTFFHIIINGLWTTGNTTRYQYGINIGLTAGNNLTHFIYHLRIQNIRYGLFNNGSQVSLIGGGFAGGEVAIRVGAAGFNNFTTLRCESYERLFTTTTGSSVAPMISMCDVVYAANDLNADGYWIRFDLGGTMSIREVYCKYLVTGAAPKISVQPGGGGYSKMMIEGLAVTGADAPYAVSSLFTVGAKGSVLLDGYVSMDSGGHSIGVEKYSVNDPTTAFTQGMAPAVFGRTGEYWGMPIIKNTSVLVAGTMYMISVYVPFTVTIDRIGAEITTLAAGSTLSLGIYNDNGFGQPGNLLLDAGTIDGGTVTAQEKTISQVLTAGNIYHLAALCQGGTPTVRTLSGSAWNGFNTSLVNATSAAAATLRAGRAKAGNVGIALPSSATSGAGPSLIGVSMAVRFV